MRAVGTAVRSADEQRVQDSSDSVQRVHWTFGSSTIRYREPGWVERLGPELGPFACQKRLQSLLSAHLYSVENMCTPLLNPRLLTDRVVGSSPTRGANKSNKINRLRKNTHRYPS